MFAGLLPVPIPIPDILTVVNNYVAIDDPQVMPHLATMLATVSKTKNP
jgi:hypothetical protein